MSTESARKAAERTHAKRITKKAEHSGVFGDGTRHIEKTPTFCDAAKRHAYSDATTPGFFFDTCSKHRPVVEPAPPAKEKP